MSILTPSALLLQCSDLGLEQVKPEGTESTLICFNLYNERNNAGCLSLFA